ncbi:hypothetical protein [Leptodesmis sp.]
MSIGLLRSHGIQGASLKGQKSSSHNQNPNNSEIGKGGVGWDEYQ